MRDLPRNSCDSKVKDRRKRRKRGTMLLDRICGSLILFSVVFAPWAFGTVHPWAIAFLNSIAFVLGFISVLCQWRNLKESRTGGEERTGRYSPLVKWAICTNVIILAYMTTYVLNPRADFDDGTLMFHYFDSYIEWLPHSFSRGHTISFLIKFTALCCYFWATYLWLTNGNDRKVQELREDEQGASRKKETIVPDRVYILLSVIVVNAALIALVGIIQRFDGNQRLLWILEPAFPNPESHFGPFAYRGNAGSFFNAIWPLAIFLILEAQYRVRMSLASYRAGSEGHIILYPLVLLLLVVPFFSNSRASAIVALVMIGLLLGWKILFSSRRGVAVLGSIGFGAMLIGSLSLVGVDKLLDRFNRTVFRESHYKGLHRFEMYLWTYEICKEHPFFGTGPGTFSSTYFVYRGLKSWKFGNTEVAEWSAWAHSDPLEFLATLGIFGFSLLVLLLLLVLVSASRAIRGKFVKHRGFLLYLSMLGFFLHSFVDFPFQVYSLFHLLGMVVSSCLAIGQCNLPQGTPEISVNA